MFLRELFEAPKKVAVAAFGRMNPPTIGHEKLVDKVKSFEGDHYIFLSQTVKPKDNPLPFDVKLEFAKKFFLGVNVGHPSVRTPIQMLQMLEKLGYTDVIYVAGSDRVASFDKLFNDYNGKEYNFDSITVENAGERDPDAEGAEGMSASKMRAAASSNDFSQFSQGLPKAVSNSDAKKIYNSVRSGMGLKEQKEFKNHVQLEPVSEIRESYMDGKLFDIGDEVVIKGQGIVAEIKHLGANYVIVESKGEVYRKWLTDVEKVNPNDEIEYEVHDFLQLSEGREDPDIGDMKGAQPSGYYRGIKKKSTKKARAAHFKKYAEKPDDGPDKQSNYKKAPGDARAKTKPSKHTLKFKQMFGENDMADLAKKRIDREKKADAIRHDRMMDRARLRDVKKKNKETKA